jgi:hypothetical protein
LADEVAGSTALAFLFSAIAALGVGLVVAGVKRALLRLELLLTVLVMIATLDLSRANLGAYHAGPAEAVTFTPPFAEALKTREGATEPGRFRIITIERDKYATPQHLRPLLGPYGAESIERRQALDLEHNAQFHLETVIPYLSGYSRAFAAMSQATMEQRAGIETAARLNVSYYIGRRFRFQADSRFTQAPLAELPGYDLALVQNPIAPKPRAYLSRRPERATAPVDPARLLRRSDFLNGEVDVIETSDVTLPGPASGGLTAIERYRPEEVRVGVETPQPGVLILLDAFDKGWRATLESGVEIPIMRANTLVRAVAVPAGAHVVTFRYGTPFLMAGALVSSIGAGACLLLIARLTRRTNTTSIAP